MSDPPGLFARLRDVDLAGPDAELTDRERNDWRRVLASFSVSATGVVLFVPMVLLLLSSAQPMLGRLLASLGAVLALGLVVAGYVLYRSDFSAVNTVRIAGWNLLGVAVLGAVMLLLLAYQRNLGVGFEEPAFTVATLLIIGAVAHVLIGVHDARRVRAEQLTRERRNVAVLNRVVRHNLRNEATVLLSHADYLRAHLDGDLRESAVTLSKRAAAVGALADKTEQLMALIEGDTRPTEPASVADAVSEVIDDLRQQYPEADVSTSVPDGLRAAGDDLRLALEQLVENALEHGGAPVAVSAVAKGDQVAVTVADTGSGVPAEERAVVMGSVDITQLNHASGLGLWIVRAIADAHGGDLSFSKDADSATVTVRLPRADG